MKYIKLLLLLLVMAEVQTTFGQGWVVSGSYTYDMTVTAVLNVNCVEMTNPSNQIAAFINGEVRGVALSSTVVKGRYVALLTIRSNVASAESVSFKIYNAATGNITNAVTKVLFQDDAVYGTPSDPYDIRTNSAPANLALPAKSIAEGNMPQPISAITVSDADITDTHTYSLVSGTGSTDNSSFVILGNQLFSNGALNYDLKTKYKIRIQAADNNGCSTSDSFTISVTDRNFPATDILISNNTIDENKTIGSVVGVLTSVDQDKTDVFTYTLVSGVGADDNSKFVINGNLLTSNTVFDYEVKAAYTIRVQTKDAGNNTFEKVISIGVNNINDKPNVNDNTLGVEEYTLNGKVLGTMSGSDTDIGQTLTYSFINTPPQTVFGINSVTGEVSLLSNTLNYQTTKSYTLKVIALDNGSPALSDTATLTVTVLYQNFSPTDISINKTTVKENSLAGTKAAEFGTYDKNIEDVFTYSLVNGLDADDNGSFTISGNSLLTSSVFDYETKASYKIRVQTKDAGNNTFEKTFTISVDNVNDKPNINDKTLGVEEYAASNFIFGSIAAIDADAGQTLTYSFINTPPQTVFGINSVTGEVSLLSNTLNYQTTKFYTLKVVALDNGGPALSDTSTLTIQVVYQNFSPTDISISKTTVKENSFAGTKVGEFGTIDKNIEDVFTYSLVNGLDADDNGRFVINGNSLLTSSVFDYETKAFYKIRVQTKDAGNNTFEKSFLISVDNVNDKPTINDKTLGVEEKAVNGKVLGIMTGSDADVGQALTYSLLNIPQQTIFGINASTGEVSLLSNTLNFQLVQSYTLQVVALDNGTPALSDTAALRIIVLYQNYAPTDISISNRNIKENISLNTKIADLASFDKNDGDVFTYTLVDGVSADDNGSFVITGNGLYTNSLVDYESKTTYNIRVQTKDLSGNTFQKPFVINVTDVNEQPQLQDQIMTVDEAAIAGTVLGRMEAVNEDRFQTLAFYIVNAGIPQSTFKIDQSTGDISLLTGNLNYATTQSYTLKIAVKDSGIPSLSDTATLKILVSDKNYPPTVLLISNDNINENKPANSPVAVFSSTDLDIHETFTYTLVSGANSSDNSKFLIKGDSLLTKASLNYEAKPTYTIRVQTKDSGGNTLEESFTILVNDLNETPKLTNQTVGVEENAGSGKFIVKMTAVDEDNNQHLTYSFTGASSAQNTFRIDPVTGEVTLNSNALDYEKVKSYTLNILVVDDGDPILSDTATLSINVLDVVENTLASVDYVSANGDGKNDYWVIENVSIYSEYSLMIFDANGIMVYKVDGGYDNSWNGLYNGSELPIGAYYYVLSSSDKSKSFKGTISLVR